MSEEIGGQQMRGNHMFISPRFSAETTHSAASSQLKPWLQLRVSMQVNVGSVVSARLTLVHAYVLLTHKQVKQKKKICNTKIYE